jgi:O-antigen/teichoic acid export membrane protein
MGIIQRQSIKGTLVFVIGAGIHFFSMLILLPKLIPVDSPEQAIYRVYINLIMLFSVLGTGGIGGVVLKHLSDYDKNPLQKKAFNTVSFCFALACACLAVIFIYISKDVLYAWKKTDSPFLLTYFWVIPFSTFFMTLLFYFESYSVATYRLTAPSVVKEIIMKAILCLAIFLFGTKVITAYQFFQLYAFSYFVGFIIISGYCVFIRGFRFSFDFIQIKKIPFQSFVPYLLYIFSIGVLATLILNIDQPIVYGMAGANSINIYGLAVTAASMITIPYKPLASILLPFMYDAWKTNDIEKLNKMNLESSRNLTAIGVLLYMLLVGNIQFLIAIIGQQFQPIVWPLIIIGIGRVIDYTTGTSSELMFSAPSHKKMIVFMALTFLFSLGCYYVFIPAYKEIGAAISCTLTLVFFNILKYFHLKKHYQLQPLAKESIYFIIVGIGILVVSYFIPSTNILIVDLVIKSSFLAGIYFGIVYYCNWMPVVNTFIKSKLPLLLKK